MQGIPVLDGFRPFYNYLEMFFSKQQVPCHQMPGGIKLCNQVRGYIQKTKKSEKPHEKHSFKDNPLVDLITAFDQLT